MTSPYPNCQAVLVVEDDRDILEAYRDALELEGYRVLTAANGKEALEVLEKVDVPCLILLDLFMPVMDGWQFLRQLEQRKGNTVMSVPVVVVSAAGAAAQDVAREVDGFIKKPVDLDVLLDTVRRYCCEGAQDQGDGC